MPTFDSKQTRTLAQAFDMAWDMILREGAWNLPDVESIRILLAKRILRLAKAGPTDERRLSTAAVMYLRTQQLTKTSGGGVTRSRQDARRRDWYAVDRRPVADTGPALARPEKIP